ncbi:hypothetical protein BJY01DRAFT_237136 [Aspergillus pseudoustus]|uniref:Fungal-specific transcription factor domain-containing protein n=1 Tax=Aspergillus pseudoustus TaxID=1810923 RepID=A0ABR4JH28_9EURO
MSDSHHLCPQCHASFRRLEHLERHLLCHRGDRPFCCTFCTQSFKRSDVLQRHWRTCKPRIDTGAEIPQLLVAPRPKRRRACDRCVRLKKGCTQSSPCEACHTRNYECTYRYADRTKDGAHIVLNSTSAFTTGSEAYSAPSDTLSPLMDSDYAFNFRFSPAPLDPTTGLEIPTSSRFIFGKFRFLDRFTSVTGFVSSFECMREYEVRELATVVTEMVLTDKHEDIPISLDFLPLSLPHTEPIGPYRGADSSESSSREWLSDPLAAVTNKLVCGLKEVATKPSPGSSINLTWSSFIENVCIEFFSPPNVRRYLVYFWSFWYPNCPIIHKPSFDVYNTPYTLLLSMALIGSSFAPEEGTSRNARLWFDCAEELIFADEHFRRAVSTGDRTTGDFHIRRDAVKALQAAYLMCLLQNWEGDANSKRRIRRVRFSMVTSIARELGFAPGSHHQSASENESWESFVAKEELNRTLAYIFLLDTAFVIFNNTPPKVSVAELNFGPVCPEQCFQAATASDCFKQLAENDKVIPIATCSIAALVYRICQGELTAPEREYLARLGKLNLFMIVSAFHTLLFHGRNTLAPQAAIIPIQQGLNNWKLLWAEHERQNEFEPPDIGLPSPVECWKRTGFMEYAPEYWTLAQAMILSVQQAQTISDPQSSSSLGLLLTRFDENDMNQLHRFIKWVSNAGLLRV